MEWVERMNEARTYIEGHLSKWDFRCFRLRKRKISSYYIAVDTQLLLTEGMLEYILPQLSYAVFEAVGPLLEAVSKMQQRVVAK